MENKDLLNRIILIFLSSVMIALSCVFLDSFHKAIKLTIVFAFIAAFFIFCLLGSEHRTVLRVTTVVTIFAAVIISLYILAEQLGWIAYLDDFDAIRDFILGTKQWGIITYLVLTIMQVVFLPIPSAVTILIGVVIYGPLTAFLVSLVGTYIGSLICFILGKSFGRKLVVYMVGKEKADKYSKMLNDKGKWVFVLMLLFPFFPDDTLCLVAGSTTMSWKFFMLSVVLTRPFQIAFTSFFGSGDIIPFSGWGIPVWIAIFALCIALLIVANKVKDKLLSGKFKRRKSSK